MTNLSINQPNIHSKLYNLGNNSYSLIVEPLAPGYGHTLGNPLRRIMLSSIPGTAVTKIKINGVSHEYQAISGVVEDALELILNLKSLSVGINNDDEKVTLSISSNKAGKITASDFKGDKKNYTVANPDLYICTVDKGGNLDIEVEISKGVGYLPTEKLALTSNINPQNLLVDANFNPVINVAIQVEDIRVGDMTNYDKLTLNFQTNGTLTGEEVIKYSLALTQDLFQKITSATTAIVESSPENKDIDEEAKAKKIKKAPVKEVETIEEVNTTDEIKLIKKIVNILAKNNINTNQELKDSSKQLEEIAGLDEKMLTTIQKYLSSLK